MFLLCRRWYKARLPGLQYEPLCEVTIDLEEEADQYFIYFRDRWWVLQCWWIRVQPVVRDSVVLCVRMTATLFHGPIWTGRLCRERDILGPRYVRTSSGRSLRLHCGSPRYEILNNQDTGIPPRAELPNKSRRCPKHNIPHRQVPARRVKPLPARALTELLPLSALSYAPVCPVAGSDDTNVCTVRSSLLPSVYRSAS